MSSYAQTVTALVKALASQNIRLSRQQAREVVDKFMPEVSAKATRISRKDITAKALAREHAIRQLFVSTGRYGGAVELFFEELRSAYALGEPEDITRAVACCLQGPNPPILTEHVLKHYRPEELPDLFEQACQDAEALIWRTLTETRTLLAAAPEYLYVGPINDWQREEGLEASDISPDAQRQYEAVVRKNHSQICIGVRQPHVAAQENAQLYLEVSITEGAPRVQVTRAPFEDPLFTIFVNGAHVEVL